MRVLRSLFVSLVPAIAEAQGVIIPRCPPPPPREDVPVVECLPPVRGQAQVVRTRSDVRVELRDRVLRYEVEERFVNRGGTIGEADYVFPLPGNAAFRDLKLSIDGQLVAGETMSAGDARRIYEDIVRRQRDPALVEWMGRGLLRTRIFPIQPGEERRVVVRFESVAAREGDALRVDYFRGSDPRRDPAPGWRIMPADRHDAFDRDAASRHLGGTTFTLTYRTGGELGEAYSPTHELDVARDDVARRVSIRGGAGGPDITVLVSLRRSLAASVTMLPYADRGVGGEPGFALVTVSPPDELARNRAPRDVTFVLDVSGSMSGRKLEQAKAAGRRLLETLSERDRFRLIDFSTDVHDFRDDFVFATRANVADARQYLDGLDASGSTNIAGALDAALRRPDRGVETRSDRMPLVLFMTDGAPTVGEQDPAAIAARAARLRGDARVFTFGLGADVNVSLIEQLALEGRGTATFVRPGESVERAVELLATRLRQPVLADVRVSTEGDRVRLSRMYPSAPTDVFAGQDLVVLARYEGGGPANIVVTGRQPGAGNRTVRWSRDVNFPRADRDNAFVPRLWATQRIGWLTAERRHGGGSSEVDDEIRRLGERFGIPTEFTSYLVQEPGRGGFANQSVPLRRGAALNLDHVVTTAAPSVSGAAAARFEAARQASAQRAARSVAAAAAATAADASAPGQTVTDVRHAGSRIFARDGDRWVDTRMKPGLKVYRVKAYSRGYFTLLEKLPELREAFAVADRVLVAGASVAIEVVDDAPELGGAELRAIVDRW